MPRIEIRQKMLDRIKNLASGVGERTILTLMIVVGVGAHLVLIWAWPYPPIIDWPDHMARHYLEARALAGQSLPSGYEINYALIPNLGSDLVMPLLLQIFPLTVASRLFLTFDILVCWLGFALFVSRQNVKSTNGYGASLLVLPWIITVPFFTGFLNYTSGLGLAFLVFLNYQRLFEKARPLPLQYVLHSLLIALLYVWHLAALGVYLVLHASHLFYHVATDSVSIVGQRTGRLKTFAGLATLLPVSALILSQKLMNAPVAVAGEISWIGPAEKARQALASVFSYNIAADVVVIAFWLAGLALMVRVEALRRARFDWLHLAALAFFGLYVVLPFHLGTTWNVDARVLPPLLICCIGLIGRLPARRVLIGAAIVLLATVTRIGVIYASWAGFNAVDAHHLDFIRQLPVGARVLVTGFDGSRFDTDARIIAWAVPEKQAIVSSLFDIPGQQPLRVTINRMGPFAQRTQDGLAFDAKRVRAASFDYVWCFNPQGKPVSVPADWVRVYAVGSITVWKTGRETVQ